HARIEVKDAIQLAATRAGGGAPRRDLLKRVQDRRQIVSDQRRSCISRTTIQNEDAYVRQRVPERYTLFEAGHKECIAVRTLANCPRDWNGTKPIAVRFHHRTNRGAGEPL